MSDKSPQTPAPSCGCEEAVPAPEPANPAAAVLPAAPAEAEAKPARFYGPI